MDPLKEFVRRKGIEVPEGADFYSDPVEPKKRKKIKLGPGLFADVAELLGVVATALKDGRVSADEALAIGRTVVALVRRDSADR